MKNIFKTILALLLCFIMWFSAGLLFNSLPALLYITLALSYYCLALVVYLFVSGSDKISNGIGVFVSVCFFILYVFFVLDGKTDWFAKIVFIAGAMSGIGFTPICLAYKKDSKPPVVSHG